MKSFYLTTTLPYVNAAPHLGHALEFVHADIIARYRRMRGDAVFFNIGTDEHGQKIYDKALAEGRAVEEYVTAHAENFRTLAGKLGLSEHNFIRTTDPHHKASAQAFWRACRDRGDIYKKHYSMKYCVGCELPKTDSELVAGACPLHPTTPIETRDEENYFFRFSRFAPELLALYDSGSDFIIPDARGNEIRAFVSRGLEDFSISRLKENMSWGVPVPDDDDHVMYVWFDALVNYVSAIGWPDDKATFERWWPVVQMAGKDNLRQQSAMWQAMLLSAGIAPSRHIIIHGFITSEGQKMSKSVGNVVDPLSVISDYGTDALRYYLAREIPTFEDGDFTHERFKEAYNANLANGIGNASARVLTMAVAHGAFPDLPSEAEVLADANSGAGKALSFLDSYAIKKSADALWDIVAEIDGLIQREQPFKTIKTDKEKAVRDIKHLVGLLWQVAVGLSPFLPETAEHIKTAIRERRVPAVRFMRR